MNALTWIGVGVIGGCGAVLRFLVDGAVIRRAGTALRLWPLPYGTLVVNLSGAFLLGFVTGMSLSRTATLLAGTAAVGAYTTFSTWMFETQRKVEERQTAVAAANVAVSLAAGLAAAALGEWVAGLL